MKFLPLLSQTDIDLPSVNFFRSGFSSERETQIDRTRIFCVPVAQHLTFNVWTTLRGFK